MGNKYEPDRHKEFSGELAEPLRRLGLLASEDEWIARSETLRAKLDLLLAHYEIDPDSPNPWVLLCLALAREFVPGFQEAKPKVRGRPAKWTAMTGGALVVEVEREMRRSGKNSAKAAARVLAGTAPWKEFLSTSADAFTDTTPDPPEALRKMYVKHKGHRWSKVMRDAFRWNEEAGTVDEWDKIVAACVASPGHMRFSR